MIKDKLAWLEKKINSLCLPEGTYKPTMLEVIKAAIVYHQEGRNILPDNLDPEHMEKLKKAIMGGAINDKGSG